MTLRPVTPYQFAAFRIVLGVYLFIHFVSLILFDPEIFREAKTFPNIFAALGDPLLRKAFVVFFLIFSLLLTVGWKRRWVALFLLYGWTCLHNWTLYIVFPGLACVVSVLLALALVPQGEPWTFKEKGHLDWNLPKELFLGAWILLTLGYAIGAIQKLGAPVWVNGEALLHALNNPLAGDTFIRDTFIRDWLIATPGLLKGLTWSYLALQLLFAPLALFTKTRPWAWLAMVGMHLGILCLFHIPGHVAGVLALHFFTFDSRWLKPKIKDPDNPPVVFFDGVCGLCDRYVDFVMREDQAHVYKVSPLQGETARQRLDPDLVKDLNTIVLLEDNKTWFKSSAVLRTLKGMGGFWALFYVFIFIPEAIRNLVYDLVARYRYKVFGKTETCRLPTPKERDLFLD